MCSLEEPKRISIQDAINENRERLVQLKMEVIDFVSEDSLALDDIFLVRYLLSHKTIKDAAEAVRFSCNYRRENESWLSSAREGDYSKAPYYEELFRKHLTGGPHRTTVHGAPVVIIRGGMTDTSIMMSYFTPEQVTKYMNWDKECSFWKCDKITRETGLLTKVVVIMDLTNYSFKNYNQSFFSALGASSKQSELLHPQLVQRTAILNAGSGIMLVWKVARLFLSQKTIDKMGVCTGFDKAKGSSACPFARKWISPSKLPTFVGGECQCEGGCVGGMENDFVGYKNSSLK